MSTHNLEYDRHYVFKDGVEHARVKSDIHRFNPNSSRRIPDSSPPRLEPSSIQLSLNNINTSLFNLGARRLIWSIRDKPIIIANRGPPFQVQHA